MKNNDDIEKLDLNDLLSRIKDNVDHGGRKDLSGEEYAQFAWSKAQEYGAFFGVDPLEILRKIESRRSYWAVNYYQEANFPSLENVHVFDTEQELKDLIAAGFRCPACNGISKSPYECDTGLKMSEGKVCDWKSYGLFGTLGKGLTFTAKETFLDHCKVDNCFYPVGMEDAQAELS